MLGSWKNEMLECFSPVNSAEELVTLPDPQATTKWIHLRSDQYQTDLFVFSWGFVRPISEICDVFHKSSLPNELMSIPQSHAVILTGHSEGSGWAVCASDFMHENTLLNPRRIIASGSLLMDPRYHLTSDVESRMNPIFLQVATRLSGTSQIVPDILTVSRGAEGVTFPQFAYACATIARTSLQSPLRPSRGSPAGECLDPQPQIILEEALSLISELDFSQQEILKDLHAFANYRKCFRACYPYFLRNRIAFAPNVAPFIKTADMSTFAQRAEVTSPLILPQPSVHDDRGNLIQIPTVQMQPRAAGTVLSPAELPREYSARPSSVSSPVNSPVLPSAQFGPPDSSRSLPLLSTAASSSGSQDGASAGTSQRRAHPGQLWRPNFLQALPDVFQPPQPPQSHTLPVQQQRENLGDDGMDEMTRDFEDLPV